ncbi:hypothetical protein N657DRAFT_156670 [Parathielavia appendiculata]|uniref:Uncharacterized protein n=1 Tax=Parathielavia appendiculata TaxID=2587402 RepID=A0AAN6TTT3_9PEZI|nr:hypothetical protein N657DRAFT_156670 [Parathielavia appendiculata]
MCSPQEDGKGQFPNAFSLGPDPYRSGSFVQNQVANLLQPRFPDTVDGGVALHIDKRFLTAYTPPSPRPRFWQLPGRPQRSSAPRRFPPSTHQPPDTPPSWPEPEPALYTAASSPAFSLPVICHDPPFTGMDPRAESEAMSPWQPQTGTLRGGDDDDLADLAATAAPAGSRQDTFVASQGDAMLLNAMDHQRSSAEQWMEMLQRPAGDRGEPVAAQEGGEDWVLVDGRDACLHGPVGGTCPHCGRTLTAEDCDELGMDQAGMDTLWKYVYGDGPV